MKKCSLLLLSVLIALSLCACQTATESDEATSNQELYEYSFVPEESAARKEPTIAETTTAEKSTKTDNTTAQSTTAVPQTSQVETTTKQPVTTTIAVTEKKNDSVTITINCASILENRDKLKKGKEYFVPSDGVILPASEIEITEGDTAFDILKKVCADHSIQLEYTYSAGFGTYYVEGIHQLYEKDCGGKSGWLYRVNGEFPSVGCSSYELHDGDTVEFLYTCDMGDVF